MATKTSQHNGHDFYDNFLLFLNFLTYIIDFPKYFASLFSKLGAIHVMLLLVFLRYILLVLFLYNKNKTSIKNALKIVFKAFFNRHFLLVLFLFNRNKTSKKIPGKYFSRYFLIVFFLT